MADLLGEGSPGHSDYIRARDRERNGLTLRDAIESHLVWRQRLNDMISGIRQAKTMASGEVRSTEQCALGRWIRQLHPVAAGSPDALARAHRDFHEYAARILGTQQKGDRLAAFDMLVGPEFREISRRLVLHTVSRFKDQAGQEP